jgi:membrane protease YdiL (CAAX protease family)
MSVTSSTSGLQSSSLPSDPSTKKTSRGKWIRLKQFRHLGIVLAVSLAGPIIGSSYVLFGGTTGGYTQLQQEYRLIRALVTEGTSLLLLWYVLAAEGKRWRDIGWQIRLSDIPQGFGIFLGSIIVAGFATVPVQHFYRSWTGHWLMPKDLHPLFGFGVSLLSIVFTCVNPFFEELIVRAYTMSEIQSAGGSVGVAIVVSLALQMSYHLYQGAAHAIGLATIFTIFSIYYAQTRRIAPIIVAHLIMDSLALARGF